MSDKEFEAQMLERVARIETHIDIIQRTFTEMSTIKTVALHADQSCKSAHKRLDDLKHDICWTLGVSMTVVGIFASVLTSVLR